MTTKLTAVEGWAQVFKTIIDECDPQALTEADGYVWRYVANQRKEIERLRAENAELRKSVATMACGHKDIGLPDCRICDPRAKPGAGT